MENKKITVLHIHEKFYPHMGGSTHRLLNLLRGVDMSKFNIIVLCLRVNEACDYEEYNEIKIFRFNHYYEIPRLMKKICKKYNVEIIHSHNFRSTFYSKLINHKIPQIMEMHSIYEPHNYINKFISKLLYKSVEKVIVLSDTSKKYVIEHYQISAEKITVVLNGLFDNNNDEIVDSAIAKKIPDDTINLSYIGSLDDFQGIDNIVKLINETTNDNIFYSIIGGEVMESLEVGRKIMRPNNVQVTPYIDSREVPAIYSKTDYLMVLRPSCLMTDTAIPLKPIEALKYGALVISTMVGGMREIASDLKTNNIIFFDSIDSIIEFVNKKIIKPALNRKVCDVNIDKYTSKVQSAKLSDLYYSISNKYEEI